MTTQVSSNTQSLSATNSKAGGNIAAMIFGVVVLLAVGFAPINVAHNAAHDARHAHAFPCH
ncbi:MAG: cobalt transporter [Cycloclasticus sp. symbiont of Bathymodiolus heckerae]|nr:MAG: cobalt transporter [Cycloclasticus sp. symbiont of Bathymodiolus heckerae]